MNAGPNVLRFVPPLIISHDGIKRAVAIASRNLAGVVEPEAAMPILRPAQDGDRCETILELAVSQIRREPDAARTRGSRRAPPWRTGGGGEPGDPAAAPLVPLTETLVEIRSLAIAQEQQGKGVGGQIVLTLVEMAASAAIQGRADAARELLHQQVRTGKSLLEH